MDVGMDVGRLLDRFFVDFGTKLGGKLGSSWHKSKKLAYQSDIKKSSKNKPRKELRENQENWSLSLRESLRDPLNQSTRVQEGKPRHQKHSPQGTRPRGGYIYIYIYTYIYVYIYTYIYIYIYIILYIYTQRERERFYTQNIIE